MRAMTKDRHIYITTAVLAVVLAVAINVFAPRDPFAGTIVHRESDVVQAAPDRNVDVSATATTPQRAGASL